jgi:hypothetical protein
MNSLGYSPIRYTEDWPPVSGSQKSQKRKPHSNASTIIPSGIKPLTSSVLHIPDDIGIGVTTGSNNSCACDCNELNSKIKRLTDENRTLSDMLDRHMELEKNKKKRGGSKRSRKSSTSRRKYKHKYRSTRVRRY